MPRYWTPATTPPSNAATWYGRGRFVGVRAGGGSKSDACAALISRSSAKVAGALYAAKVVIRGIFAHHRRWWGAASGDLEAAYQPFSEGMPARAHGFHR